MKDKIIHTIMQTIIHITDNINSHHLLLILLPTLLNIKERRNLVIFANHTNIQHRHVHPIQTGTQHATHVVEKAINQTTVMQNAHSILGVLPLTLLLLLIKQPPLPLLLLTRAPLLAHRLLVHSHSFSLTKLSLCLHLFLLTLLF